MIPTIGVHIETATTCNASCRFCLYPSVSKARSGKQMSNELFHKIADELATIPSISEIKFVGLNEPLLDQRLEVFITRVKSPSIETRIYTNGLLLTPKRYDSLREAGLSSLTISLNAVRSEQHEQIMGMNGKFDIVCNNADYARKFVRPRLQVHATYTTDTFTEKDTLAFYERWGDARCGGVGLVVREANWGGELELPGQATSLVFGNLCCFRAISEAYITFDGTVTACCMDPLGRMTFGNLNEQTFREIYNSEKYLEFRKSHAQNRADKFDICRGCTRV